MANEIRVPYPGVVALNAIYVMVRNLSNEVWYPTGGAFEAYGTSGRTAADYAIICTDRSGGLYTADFPEDIAVGTYTSMSYLRTGATPADVPTDSTIGAAQMDWTGSAPAAEAVSETTATSICNLALMKLGQGLEIIGSIYDGSPNASHCLILYPQVRNEVLVKLKKTAFGDLGAQLTGASLIVAAEWEYQFSLPSDCLTVVGQVDEGNHDSRYSYDIKKGIFLTNELTNDDGDSAYIEYAYLENLTTKYGPMEIEAIATRLAAELAPTIRAKNPEIRMQLLEEYRLIALPNAIIETQAQVYVPDEEGDTSWLDARSA